MILFSNGNNFFGRKSGKVKEFNVLEAGNEEGFSGFRIRIGVGFLCDYS
jgi:hypothetical protein